MTKTKLIAGAIGSLGLLSLASAQSADWRRVEQAGAGGTSFYLDVNSPRRDPDGMLTAHVLSQYSTDQRTQGGQAYKSSKRVVRFDCAKERLADQSITFYAESQGRGAVVQHMERTHGEANAALEPTEPSSSGKAMVYAACEVYSRGKPVAR